MDRNAIQLPSRLPVGIASVWLGFGLVDATQTVFVMRAQGMHHAWVKLFVATVFFWLPWALATAPVARLARYFPPSEWQSASAWLAHLSACSFIGLLFTAWITWLERFFHLYAGAETPGSFAHLWLDRFYSGIVLSLVLYSGILVVTYLVQSRARLADQQTETARLNEQLSKAQLDALRKQIEPHFLFNTLNAIASLVRAGSNNAAVTMLAELGDLIRHTLKDSARQLVPLEEEIEFIEKYLSIQKARFADRLQVSVDVPMELSTAQVPSLILQPIVENAITHGIAKRMQGGTIRIAASQCDGMLTLTVCNDGPSLAGGESTGSGIGTCNVRNRLRSLYGSAFEFSMRNADAGGVMVSVSLPYADRIDG